MIEMQVALVHSEKNPHEEGGLHGQRRIGHGCSAVRGRFSLLKYDIRKRCNSIPVKSCKSRIDAAKEGEGERRSRVEERKREEGGACPTPYFSFRGVTPINK